MSVRSAPLRNWRLALAAAGLAVLPVAGPGAAEPNDPHFTARGTWGQGFDDQWGLKRIGFTAPSGRDSAWDIETGAGKPVVVAVIDTGLDYFHPDLARENVWRNPKEQPNGRDDDGNGYVDDLIGWNFVDDDNNPWDVSGHGTHVAGIIAASTGNGEGIAGIHRGVRIMPLKVMNFAGYGGSDRIAEAVFYAVGQGARVINLSLGSDNLSPAERLAIDHAHDRGAVVVVAAGNAGADMTNFGPAGLDRVIAVAASDADDRAAGFSNWGARISVTAPGVDILSLRARQTDLALTGGAPGYETSSGFVGREARYYRASGTSFAAPFVSGVVALLFSRSPKLTAAEAIRLIEQSARDIETPGRDQLSGYGLLDARAALSGDPAFYIEAAISGVQVVTRDGGPALQVNGTAAADRLARAWLEIGPGEAPREWRAVATAIERNVAEEALGAIPAGAFAGAAKWTLRVKVEHENGRRREARFNLSLQ